jgi:hypothetical protein
MECLNAVEILSDEKPTDTQRSGELRFYFMPVVPNELTLKILGPQQCIHGILFFFLNLFIMAQKELALHTHAHLPPTPPHKSLL